MKGIRNRFSMLLCALAMLGNVLTRVQPFFMSFTLSRLYCSTELALEVMFNKCRCRITSEMRACWTCSCHKATAAHIHHFYIRHIKCHFIWSPSRCCCCQCVFVFSVQNRRLIVTNCIIFMSLILPFSFCLTDTSTWVRLQEATIGWACQLSRELEGSWGE